ncbi:hypothetical protein AVBRAN12654_09320, partial [Campylobacter sp. RM12654]|uniref:hypothetical protein n=1 Tax=Campylobacter sp. RM12654 TaxID=2735738 RepID=UPI0030154F25|nr:hypothetical protein [Campylobacter sp. RM12654]
MMVNGVNNFSNTYMNNQSKVNKPYYEDGKASLEYLKLAQEKLENDPTYKPLYDNNLGLRDKLTYGMYGALDPDVVKHIRLELEKSPEIDTEELVKTLNKLFKNLDKLTSDSIS